LSPGNTFIGAFPEFSSYRMQQPNIILIYADDLGFGDLACYGASGIPTPNLDRMAREGLRFTNSYATAATCTPSRLSLLTGAYPWRNPEARILAGDAPMLIKESDRTVPGTLREAGYTTAVIGKWHIGLGNGTIDWNGSIRPCPLDVGFDHSYVMAATNDRVPCVFVDGDRVDKLDPADPISVSYAKENPYPEIPTGKENPELLTRMRHSDQQHYDTIVNGVGRIGFCRGGASATWDDETMSDVFLSRAKAFISEQKETPFFLYYALHQPHVPRLPGPRFAGSTGQGPRGDVIAELDDCVGHILDHLTELGIEKDTLVVFSSDNGPILDDGYLDEARERCGEHKPAGPLRGGKYSMFDGGARVPMIAWLPGQIAPGESPALFSHVDFLLSLAHMAGASVPQDEAADSLEMSSVLLGTDTVGRAHLVTEGLGAKTVLREGNWVYLPPNSGPALFADKGTETGNSPVPQLYDLNADIGQQSNVAEQFPDKLKDMQQLLETIHGDTPPSSEDPVDVSSV
jgi:arylsulfatase A-like enzyme